jgi:hypothetical protein
MRRTTCGHSLSTFKLTFKTKVDMHVEATSIKD